MKFRILLVDDHPILTDGLKMLLRDNERLEVVGTFHAGKFALAFLNTDTPVDLAILDYTMPDMTGVELMKRMKAIRPGIKVLMLSMHDEPVIIKEAISGGVNAFVLKKSVSDELNVAIDSVLAGKSFCSAAVGQSLFLDARLEGQTSQTITARESEVLKLIVKELTNKEIAKLLFISERTVEVHRKNLMRKLACTNTVGLIKYAFKNGLI